MRPEFLDEPGDPAPPVRGRRRSMAWLAAVAAATAVLAIAVIVQHDDTPTQPTHPAAPPRLDSTFVEVYTAARAKQPPAPVNNAPLDCVRGSIPVRYTQRRLASLGKLAPIERSVTLGRGGNPCVLQLRSRLRNGTVLVLIVLCPGASEDSSGQDILRGATTTVGNDVIEYVRFRTQGWTAVVGAVGGIHLPRQRALAEIVLDPRLRW